MELQTFPCLAAAPQMIPVLLLAAVLYAHVEGA